MSPSNQSGDCVSRYTEAVDYLFRHTDYERMARVHHHAGSYDLARMRRLCQALGQPQDQIPSVHIAGTKGKGSVTTMTAHLLAGSGLKVGLYTSPHLIDLRERIAVLAPTAGRVQPGCESQAGHGVTMDWVGEDEFVAAMNRVLPALPATNQPADPPTFFEMITALAFSHFAATGVDVAALEVGLGGRLDATNVVTPRVCAITPIGMDHMRQLGPTLAHIATEKAGILKPGVPAVIAPQPPQAEQVIRRIAAERQSPVRFVGQEIRLERRLLEDRWPRRWEATVSTPGRTFPPLPVPLLGRHQADNLAVALGMLDCLLDAGWKIDLAGAWQGLAQTRWPGRLQVLARRPWIVLDGAHTVESAKAVLATLPETFDYDRLIVVAGVLADKDVAGLMHYLAGPAAVAVLTRSDHPHAADPNLLAEALAAGAADVERHVEPDAARAVALAAKLARPEDLVLVTGSIYLVGLVARMFQDGTLAL